MGTVFSTPTSDTTTSPTPRTPPTKLTNQPVIKERRTTHPTKRPASQLANTSASHPPPKRQRPPPDVASPNVPNPSSNRGISRTPRTQHAPSMEEDREEDIRGAGVEDAPVLPEYLLRTRRREDGSLSLETGGKPLYNTPNYLVSLPNSASVIPTTPPHPSPTNSGAPVSNHTSNSTAKNPFDRSKKHETQRNHLGYELRRGLRKRTVNFPRTKEASSLWTEDLFNCGDLTGAFGHGEKKRINLRGKLYLAPLTTVGNLPFRRVAKHLGADVTCGEMAMAGNLLQGQSSEWALLRRHESEDLFGVQLAGSNVDTISRAAELIGRECQVDFIELNCGCPIDVVFNRGGGCSLMQRRAKLMRLVWTVGRAVDCPVGVKMRTGVSQKGRNAHSLIGDVAKAGADWVTVHGRSRKQRYSKLADWNYITSECAPAAKAADIPLLGNGDVYNWRDVVPFLTGGEHENDGVTSVMIARGALIKPWLFTEIKERRDWDIRSSERLDIYKRFAEYGLEHWGADRRGVETTRKFLLEWLSFLYRYVPVGIVEGGADTVVTMNHRAPFFRGRDDLETLLASPKSSDWVRITEMLLGKAPDDLRFKPRHKSNAWDGGGDSGGGNGAGLDGNG